MNEQNEVRTTFSIPSYNWAGFEAKIARLNRRAARIGTAPIALDKTGERVETKRRLKPGVDPTSPLINPESYETVARTLFECTLTGETPRIKGWTFVAVVEHAEGDEGGTFLSRVPGTGDEDLPAEFRDLDPRRCDHCGKAILRRKLYVLRSDAGLYQQVGGTCLQDFLGGLSPDAIAAIAEMLTAALRAGSDDEDEDWGGFRSDLEYLPEYLGFVVGAVDTFGWVSRSAAWGSGHTATADIALETLHTRRDPEYRVTAEHSAEALRVIDFIRDNYGERESGDLSDYEWNVAVAFRGDYVGSKRIGIVASAVNLYRREIKRASDRAEREARLGAAADAWYGEPGKKFEVAVTLADRFETAGRYGSVTIFKFLTAEGCPLTWFSTGDPDGLPAVGEQAILRGTVKAHDTYRGAKTTLVTRCKFVAAAGAAA